MNNIKKLYMYYTFNKANIIILFLSIVGFLVIFNLWDFDIAGYEYYSNPSFYNLLYLKNNISIIEIVSMLVVIVILSIDSMSNNGRFDSIFLSKIKHKDIIKTQIKTYTILIFMYTTLIYLLLILTGVYRLEGFIIKMNILIIYLGLLVFNIEVMMISFLFIKLTGFGLSGIITLVWYFITSLIYDSHKIIGNIFLFHMNLDKFKIFFLGLLIAIFIIILIYVLLIKVISKKEYKIR